MKVSMTREEAINRIEDHMAVHHIGEYPHIKLKEALDLSISALRHVSREQVERMRGEWVKPHWRNSTSCAICSQCGFEAHHHEYHGVQDTYLFCPRCMAPMTDEAVDMVMKRLEAMKDAPN